ncbi:hypothetical protein [Aedoeadaptatus urinae]|uniref:hypothetical protein n=1 Tax=Aedoeadaptatus urinae TaxID=1871017 RepID=UPI00097CFB67|nr:hypothetical protein [Peptoniphilus urinae]
MDFETKERVTVKPGAEVDPAATIAATDNFPAVVGEYAIVKAGAEIVGANIGAYATIKSGTRIEEGVYVGDFAIIEENTRLPAGAKVPSRAVASGDPFTILRGLTKEELDAAKARSSAAL